MNEANNEHLVLRQPLTGKVLLGALGALGGSLAFAALISSLLDKTLTPVSALEFMGLLSASAVLASYYSTTEVHATPARFWLRRYGFTCWSIAMCDAGTTEGKGVDWRFIFVFDLKTGRKVGRFNWFMFDRRDTVAFSAFVDKAREAQGVVFPSAGNP